jgi:hypothetical protein
MGSSHNIIDSRLRNGRLITHKIGIVLPRNVDLENYLDSLDFIEANHSELRAAFNEFNGRLPDD